MPSGSKKRKSAKKPKPQGGPLDVASDEAKVSTEEEVRELFPATVGIEGDPEAMAESGFECNEMIGKSLQEVAREDFELDEANRGGYGLGDSLPPTEPEAENLAAIESEPSAVCESDREVASEHKIPVQTDISDVESAAKNDASAEVIKAEKEPDAGSDDSEPAVYAIREESLDEVKPEADIGLNESESTKESPMFERDIDLDSDALGSRSGIDETLVDVEAKTDGSSTDIDPESGQAADKLGVAAAPEYESEIGESLFEKEDGFAKIEQEADKLPNEVPVEIEPESQIKLKAEVEESETGGVPGEGNLVTGAIPADLDIEGEEKQVEEADTAASTSIEPETDEAPIKGELGTDTVPVAEVEEAPAVREVATDVAIADVEPETEAAPSDIDIDSYAQVEADAFHDEVPQDTDAVLPENESKTKGAVRESELEVDTNVAEREFSVEDSPVEIEPEVNTKLAPEREPQELEVNAADVVAPDPELEGEFLINEEPDVSVDDVENPPESELRSELSEETESEPKQLNLTKDTLFEPEQVIEPQSDVGVAGKAKLENEASVETQVEGTGSVETEACQQDSAEGDGKVSLELNPEAEVETARGTELESEAEVSPEAEPESEVEGLAETELDEEGIIPAEADLQGLLDIEPDQSAVEEQDEQLQNQDGEREIGAMESSVFENNQDLESHIQGAEAMEVSTVEDEPPKPPEPPAIPASDADFKEGDCIPPLATGLEGEGEGDSTMEVVSEESDCRGDIEVPYADVVNTEELAEENGENQEQAVDRGLGEVDTFLASAGGEVEVSTEQELGSEQPLPANTVDVEECLQEETPLTDQELVSKQPQLLISLESGLCEPDKDFGEEEAVSSTQAEAGSVLNDLEERAFSEQDLPTNFPPTEEGVDVSESKEFPDRVSIPEFVETKSREGLDSEAFPEEKVDGNILCEEEVISQQPEILLESADAKKPAKDLVFLKNAEAEAEPANYLHLAPAEEISSDEHVPSSPQPVSQESGRDEVYTSREVVLANEDPKADKEEGVSCEDDDKVAGNSKFPHVAGGELISKASECLENGQQSLTSEEAPSIGVVENGAKLGVQQGGAYIPDKAEFHAVPSKEPKGVEVKSGGADDISVEPEPPISKGRDIIDFEASRQESRQEASLPVVISLQHRDVEGASSKIAERPSEGGALNRRSKFLDCCGMFDLLLKKT